MSVRNDRCGRAWPPSGTYDMVGCYDTIEEANEVANNLETECDIWVCSEEELDQFNEDL